MQEHLKSLLDTFSKIPTREEFVKAFETAMKVITSTFADINNRIDAKFASLEKARHGKDGRDGKPGPKGDKGDTGTSYTIFGKAEPGIPGKDGSPDTPEQVRDKLETLKDEDRLDASAIKGLEDLIKNTAPKTSVSSFVISRGAIRLYDLSDKLDGITKTFALPVFWRVLQVNSSSTPNAFRPTTDYTTDASVPSITFTSAIDALSTLAGGQTLTILYAEP